MWTQHSEQDGLRRYICTCGFITPPTRALPHAIRCRCKGKQSARGVGTILQGIVRSLNVPQTAGCHCAEMVAKMNAWGPDGCRDHREEILDHLRKAYGEASILTKLRAGAIALRQGLPLTLEGLLDLAIERAAIDPSSAHG